MKVGTSSNVQYTSQMLASRSPCKSDTQTTAHIELFCSNSTLLRTIKPRNIRVDELACNPLHQSRF